MSKLVLVSGDLMLRARVEGAAQTCGLTLVSVTGHDFAVAACGDDCRLVLIDLRSTGLNVAELVDDLRRQVSQAAIVACGPHVHQQRLEAAQQAGCDLVVTRGQLERDAEAILQQFLEAG
jgi:DNA-binding NarL/FixJ family response regulator